MWQQKKTLTSEWKEKREGCWEWGSKWFMIYLIPCLSTVIRFLDLSPKSASPLHRVSAFFVSLAYTHDRLCNPLCFSLLACTQSTRKYNGNQPERSRSELMNEIKSVPFVDSSLTGGGQIARECSKHGKRGEEERGVCCKFRSIWCIHTRIPTALLPSSAIKTSN